MKSLLLSLALILPVVGFGQSSVQLVGIINLPDKQQALLEFPTNLSGNPAAVVHGAFQVGERQGDLELLGIHPDRGSATVRWHGSNIVLHLIQPRPPADGVSIVLSNAPLAAVLEVLAGFTNRTLLQHPALPNIRLTLATNVASTALAAQTIAGALGGRGIACMAYGQKFVKVFPSARPIESGSSDSPPQIMDDSLKSEMLPAGAISLVNALTSQTATIYASLMNRMLEPSQSWVPRGPGIAFKNATPLTKAEVLQALDVHFAWRGVKMVVVDAKLARLVPLDEK